MFIEINKKNYHVNSNEFSKIDHKEYFNLTIREKLGIFERHISLLNEISEIFSNRIVLCNPTHGGFIPIQVSKHFTNVFLSNVNSEHYKNIIKNIEHYNISNIKISNETRTAVI